MKKIDIVIAFLIVTILTVDMIYEYYLFTGRGLTWYKDNLGQASIILFLFISMFVSLLFIIKTFRDSSKFMRYIVLGLLAIIFFISYFTMYHYMPRIIGEVIIKTAFVLFIYYVFQKMRVKFRRKR